VPVEAATPAERSAQVIHRHRSPVSRRTFLKLAGATPVVAAAGGAPRGIAAQTEEPVRGGTLTYGSGRPPQNVINPLNSISTNQNVLIEALFLRLVYGRQWGDGLNPDPTAPIDLAVAETMTEVEPTRVWEFSLRQNVLWHDGTPVTVDDVIFGIWLALNKNAGTTSGATPVDILGGERLRTEGAPVGQVEVDGATKIGDRGLRIELQRAIPNYWVNSSVGYWPMPKHIFGETPFEQLFDEPYATMPVGNGPFKAVRYVDGQFMEFAANEDFYLGRPLVDTYIVRFADDDTLAAALEAQEIHGASIDPGPVYDRLIGLDYLVGHTVPSDLPEGFAVNVDRFPEQAAGLCRALQHAIDVESVSTQLFSGTFRPSNNLFQHIVGYEENPAGFEVRTYDPERAAAILQEIGWDSSRELEWIMFNPPAAREDTYQAMLAAVGINAKYRMIDVATVIDELYRKGNYDLLFGNMGGTQFFDFNWRYFKCGWIYDEGGYNYSRYCNDEVGALMQQGLDATDEATRKRSFDQANLLLNATPPQATIYRQSVAYVWNAAVHGAYPYQYTAPVRPAFERIWIAR
jgi:peptide/nickel transport system substrate-binding protein